jgi:hypothetical protein
MMDERRCYVTGNICGTDTVMVGMECPSTGGKCIHKMFGNHSPEYAAGFKAGMRRAAEIVAECGRDDAYEASQAKDAFTYLDGYHDCALDSSDAILAEADKCVE